ncbi:MAG: adenylate kinase [Clostridiales bacterium]|jgi:adenylate kinase|nr:adenylate kinase [Clostridiales bacterium]
MKIILTGAPGSGKGSQTPNLEKWFGISTISTGNMLRAQVAEGTPLGVQAKEIMARGGLVSDDIVIGMLADSIAEDRYKAGFILDGVPRTLGQAKMMTEKGVAIDKVIVFDVPDEVIQKRMSGRRVCEVDGSTYHVVTNPPQNGNKCDKCGAELIVREDDKPETVMARLKTYHEQTEPIIEYYKDKADVIIINGDQTIDEVAVELKEALGA